MAIKVVWWINQIWVFCSQVSRSFRPFDLLLTSNNHYSSGVEKLPSPYRVMNDIWYFSMEIVFLGLIAAFSEGIFQDFLCGGGLQVGLWTRSTTSQMSLMDHVLIHMDHIWILSSLGGLLSHMDPLLISKHCCITYLKYLCMTEDTFRQTPRGQNPAWEGIHSVLLALIDKYF